MQAQDSIVAVEIADGVTLEMVWVPGGTFTMGNNTAAPGMKVNYEASKPEHRVTVDTFYMGRFEVTQAQWVAVMGSNPAYFTGIDSLPVEQVSWDEAQQFCAMLSQLTGRRFRLPTEAEWEYAARGGNSGHGYVFSGGKDMGSCCWYCVNSGGHTNPVGRLAPNELGLYDMSGNVAEWCNDWMAPYSPDDQTNPRGPRNGESRVLRGGHYNSTSPGCTVYDRGWYLPSGKYQFYGLRLLMEVPQQEEDVED